MLLFPLTLSRDVCQEVNTCVPLSWRPAYPQEAENHVSTP